MVNYFPYCQDNIKGIMPCYSEFVWKNIENTKNEYRSIVWLILKGIALFFSISFFDM